MTPSGYRSPIAYFLPKTHKPDFKTNLKFRPIISSYDSFSYNLSKFFANMLKSQINPTCKGSFDFVYNLKRFSCNTDVKMLSLDIENLYPSIPLKYVMDKAADILVQALCCASALLSYSVRYFVLYIY